MNTGDVVAGRFRIEGVAGSGGMGVVYRSHDLASGTTVALKVLLLDGPTHLSRFEREAELLAAISHPAVVGYVAHGKAETGQLYLAMEWLEGVDLGARLEGGALSIPGTLALGVRVAGALGAAHARGVVHRDLKPANLLLPGGDLAQAKLLDFGVARPWQARGPTVAGAVLGTPWYMAPEQARGSDSVDARADVFSLGCVLFECLTGQPPFMGDHPIAVLSKVLFDEAPRVRERRSEVPAALDDLIARMLSKSPAERPADGRAVAAALAEITLDATEVPAVRDTLPPPPSIRLTTGEQRLFCVVLATNDAATQRAAIAPRGTAVIGPVDRAKLRLEPLGVAVVQLAGGGIVATISGAGTATDHAAKGARVALALRAELPDAAIAIATGRGRSDGAVPVGQVIDRAAHLLTAFARSAAIDVDDPRFAMGATALPSAEPIRIDAVTAGLLDVRFDVEEVPGEGHLLLSEHAFAEGVRTLLGKPTPCVGRDREIAGLVSLYDECVAEPIARAALVIGAAGVGKSRLRYEVTEILRKRTPEPQIWIARGDPMHATSPFGLVAPVVRRAASIQDGEPLAVRRQKLEARVARRVPAGDRARVAEFLGELIGTPFPDEASVQLRAARRDPKLMGDQMRRAWIDLCAAESAAGPLVLLIDDVHWGDSPSLDLLAAALRSLSGAPILLLGFARPEALERLPKLWMDLGAERVQLAELLKKNRERLVRKVLGDATPARTVERIVELSQGNALYLEELIRAVAEGRGDALPETVVTIMQARLEHLSPDARRVLRAASVLGEVFWEGAVRELCGRKEQAGVDLMLDDLARQELVTRRKDSRFPGEIEYVFRHALVREASYAMLTDEDRGTGHLLAGQWLEHAGETRPSVLADHFDRGGLLARAVPCYVRAAKVALAGSDLDAVLARAARGLEIGATGQERGELLLAQAEAYRWREQTREAEQAAEQATQHLPEGGPAWCLAMGELVTVQGKLTRRDLLHGSSRKLMSFAQGLDPGRRTGADPAPPSRTVQRMETDLAFVAAMSRAAVQAVHLGESALAQELLAKADALVSGRALDDPAVLARYAQARSVLALYEGDMAASARQSERAIARYLLAGDVPGACMERVNLGNAWTELGAYAEAEDETREALATAERLGLRSVGLAATINLGHILSLRGNAEDAVALERSVIDGSPQGARFESACRLYLSRALHAAGRYAEASTEAWRVVELTERVPPLRAYALASHARALLGCGTPERALAAAGQAMNLLTSLGGVDSGEALIRLTYAEALFAVGDEADARVAIAAARDRLLARAARIGDATLRERFLTIVPDNARTMALAGS